MQYEVNYLTSVSSDTVKSGGYYRIMQGLGIPLKSSLFQSHANVTSDLEDQVNRWQKSTLENY